MRYRLPVITVILLLCVGLFAPVQAQPAAPPLVGPLIAVNTSEQDRIILYDLATDGRRELSFGAGWHNVWGFSPDGCRVIFTLSDGAALAKLYSARLNGTDVRDLVQFDELPASSWGVWDAQPSPTQDRIAFVMIRPSNDPQDSNGLEHHIAFVSGAGGEIPQFYSVTGDEAEPRWSPDGQWLVYMSYTLRVPGLDVNATAAPTPEGQPLNPALLLREADLWVVSADAATKYQLTNFPTGSVRAPRWSPDNELIGFVYSPSPNNETLWMIANAPESIPTPLTSQLSLVMDMTWFPDSAALMTAIRDFHGTRDNLLWKIPLAGIPESDASLYPPDPNLSYADYPRFSPDGRWLAFRSSYNLGLLDMTTGTWRLLDEHILGNTPPVWSPAGFEGEEAC